MSEPAKTQPQARRTITAALGPERDAQRPPVAPPAPLFGMALGNRATQQLARLSSSAGRSFVAFGASLGNQAIQRLAVAERRRNASPAADSNLVIQREIWTTSTGRGSRKKTQYYSDRDPDRHFDSEAEALAHEASLSSARASAPARSPAQAPPPAKPAATARSTAVAALPPPRVSGPAVTVTVTAPPVSAPKLSPLPKSGPPPPTASVSASAVPRVATASGSIPAASPSSASVPAPRTASATPAAAAPRRAAERTIALLDRSESEAYRTWEAAWAAKQREVSDILEGFVQSFTALDENAVLAVRGSLASGIKGPVKTGPEGERLLFNPTNFDVDAYVVSDTLYEQALASSRTDDAAAGGQVDGVELPAVEAIIREMRVALGVVVGNRDAPARRQPHFTVLIRSTRNAAFKRRVDREAMQALGKPAEWGNAMIIAPPRD